MTAPRSAFIAPAGYGKTYAIVERVAAASGRTLVLTHTNAGVTALSRRLADAGVPRSAYELSTIAAYFKKWVESYPLVSGYDAPCQEKTGVGMDYERIYRLAATVLATRWAQQVVKASYREVVLDEYQDCTLAQRDALFALANGLPLAVYGDPMQAIFHWAGELADVNDPSFAVTFMDSEPHRWTNAGNPDLGLEIARIRQALLPALSGHNVTVWLDAKVPGVTLLGVSEARKAIYGQLAKYGQKCSFLYLTGHVNGQLSFCRRNMGFQFNETIECPELFEWARKIDGAEGCTLSLCALEFAELCFTRIATELKSYKGRLEKGDINFTRIKKYPDLADLLVRTAVDSGYQNALSILDWFDRSSAGFRLVRRQLLGEMMRALRYAQANGCDLLSAARKTHGDMESYEKRYPLRCLASRVLLSKGLEYDVAIVDATSIKDPRDFYVAISRCRRGLILITDNATLSFSGVAK